MTTSTDNLIRFLDHWQPQRIVVVGDFMLDRYVYGNAERLSPDAPVPVLTAVRIEDSPGGAANVCRDLVALRCNVDCLGLIGRDEPGRKLKTQLRDAGCNVAGLIATAHRPTTVKQSLVGLAQHRHPQKMFRLDTEQNQPLTPDVEQRLLDRARKVLPAAAVLCLEDYNKGVLTASLCQKLIALAKRHNVPVIVDPAAIDDYAKYSGATCITPNRFEAWLATGQRGNHGELAHIKHMAAQLKRKLKLEAAVITADKTGLVLLENRKPAVVVPGRARSVYDVSGAGDMTLAMLAAARANSADWPTAAALANIAAGLEVEQAGVVPIPLGDILLTLLRQKHEKLGKLRTLDELLPEIEAYRAKGNRIVFTNGCFDMLHAGHVQLFRQARAAGDLLIVAINSDPSIRRIKGPSRPVNTQKDRVLLLSELESIDYVIVFDADTPTELLRAIKPDILAKGGEYSKRQVVGANLVERYGGEVMLIKPVKGRSTTHLIQRIADNHTQPAKPRGRGYVTD